MTIQTSLIFLLSIFFLFASSIKIFAWINRIFEPQLEMFLKYGLNRQIMMLVGFVELFGAISIWFQGSLVATLGALALFLTSSGAIFFHLVFDSWKEGVPAMITFALSGFLVWNMRGPLLAFLGAPGFV